jgi:predicted dehydrogenase
LRDYGELSGAWSAVEDNVAIRMKSVDGPMAVLQASWTEPEPIFRLEVTCRGGGGFRVDGLGGGYGAHRILILPSSESRVWKETGWEDPRSIALTREWRKFKDCVAAGTSHIEDAIRALAVADRCAELAHR